MKWFRFYNEVLDDPKVQCIEPELFKFWINVLCIASKNDGKLPPLKTIAYHVRASESATQSLINALLEARLIQEFSNQHGTWLAPHAWHKRQYKSDTSSERVKRFRNANRNNVVTPPDTDTDTDTEKEKGEKENSASSKALSLPHKKFKGTRLSENWELPEEWGEWSEKEMGWGYEKVILEQNKFRDYWISKSGQIAVKLDWEATWRNWCRKSKEGF